MGMWGETDGYFRRTMACWGECSATDSSYSDIQEVVGVETGRESGNNQLNSFLLACEPNTELPVTHTNTHAYTCASIHVLF